jgi:hypothetical protein
MQEISKPVRMEHVVTCQMTHVLDMCQGQGRRMQVGGRGAGDAGEGSGKEAREENSP